MPFLELRTVTTGVLSKFSAENYAGPKKALAGLTSFWG